MYRSINAAIIMAGLVAVAPPVHAAESKPTVVLVHGAFADASSWGGVITQLEKDGYRVVAIANPLRGVRTDAEYVGRVVANVEGPVVMVGHSYGGFVINEAASTDGKVKALVFVAAFAPEEGETAAQLSGRFPGSTLAGTLGDAIALEDGRKDLYIRQEAFHDQFAADVDADEAEVMAVTQRPITDAALGEPSTRAAWKTIPSWFVYGDADRNIPAAALSFMAERARSRQSVVVKGASHVVMVSNPAVVTKVIEEAAAAE
ncbi:alpha/beta hydrolase [Rhizobium sp. Leaf383]|uniref:alpha/beta fold hydrolase n=1 Tax=Rhizobium sp. Leaf383 TaxID=1736357 RepID=UPI000715C2BA|nr:alpha/beta hydrolase [Rhizobium sp. Leaf383]KQS76391.1 alpha/beta hydrolase [Rhizobium sp. Leaf383]